MEDRTLILVIFSFVISITFPMFAYTFTTFGSIPDNFDTSLTPDQLESAGIILSDGESHNVTFGDPAQEFTVKNQTMRVQWFDRFLFADYFDSQQQSWIEKQFGTWLVPIKMDVQYEDDNFFIRSMDNTNSTVLSKYNTKYNWTRWECVQNGLNVFVTPLRINNFNLSEAMINGTVTVTVGSMVFDNNNPNTLNFVNWYMSIVTGQGATWGLPDFIVWIVRIFSFMMLLSAYLIITELIP